MCHPEPHPPKPEGAAVPEEALGTTPSPLNLVNQGAGLGLVPTIEHCQLWSWAGASPGSWRRCDTSGWVTEDMPTFSMPHWLHPITPVSGERSPVRGTRLGMKARGSVCPQLSQWGPLGGESQQESAQRCGWGQGSGYKPGSASVCVWPQLETSQGTSKSLWTIKRPTRVSLPEALNDEGSERTA